MAKRQLPTMLNYSRSLIPGNGVFVCLPEGGNPENENQHRPIEVRQQTVRGTIANFSGVSREGSSEETEQAKLLDPKNANIQRIDTCFLPSDTSRYYLKFSVNIAAHSLAPGACNTIEFSDDMERFALRYRDAGGYQELAGRYLQNILNGRWMWRNRYAVDKQLSIKLDKTPVYNGPIHNDFDADYSTHPGYDKLLAAISGALAGEREPARLEIIGSGDLGNGQEVYPSQEFAENKRDNEGKLLATQPAGPDGKVRQAIMHSQKIGNALRTIDDWHDKANQFGKIPIEPYGVVQQRAQAIRLPQTRDDLYTHLQNLDQLLETLESGRPTGREHYVMACLVRGGVFSGEGKKKGDKK